MIKVNPLKTKRDSDPSAKMSRGSPYASYQDSSSDEFETDFSRIRTSKRSFGVTGLAVLEDSVRFKRG